ncbi:glycosyl transferase [Sphingobacterium faecium NBRC 15299]|uniref:glycosyltransferase n=1 Tax=Sphingobacterium faecium TaxID=34087 RepID=UPI000D3C88B5|nr:glycosyltransferase [Sphingobacterium faecium]PTX06978.1 glycosyltransferase [Sphingobacterium faecium]GEM66215.1 glycosyl transferase [Sphingobacterium faecium NBRC 15299]
MKYIYIFDDYYQSLRNGIGTFNTQLLYTLKDAGYCIVIIELNSDTDKFIILEVNEIIKMRFPSTIQGWSANNFKNICTLINLYVLDSTNNVFIFNYNYFDRILLEIRELYPMSKILKIVHDLNWTTSLLGDESTFRNIINNHDVVSNINHQFIKDSFVSEKDMMSKADLIVCSSVETKQLLKDFYLIKKKIKLISNGLVKENNLILKPRSEIMKEYGFNIEDRILLYVGRVNVVKGFYIAVKAFEKIVLEYPNTRLVICGNVSDPDHIFSFSKHISSRLSFLGHVAKDELISLYRIADVGILPSYTEQCSYTAIEMMKFGLPIVCSDANGLRSMFENNVTAIVTEITNYQDSEMFVNSFYKGIKSILESESLAKRLRRGAHKKYLQSYTHDKMISKYLKLFA